MCITPNHLLSAMAMHPSPTSPTRSSLPPLLPRPSKVIVTLAAQRKLSAVFALTADTDVASRWNGANNQLPFLPLRADGARASREIGLWHVPGCTSQAAATTLPVCRWSNDSCTGAADFIGYRGNCLLWMFRPCTLAVFPGTIIMCHISLTTFLVFSGTGCDLCLFVVVWFVFW